MSISRLKTRSVAAAIVGSDDDSDLDNIINELNTHTGSHNPHTDSLDKTGDSMTGELQWGANGFVNNTKIRTHTDYTGSELFEYTYSAKTTDDTEASMTTITLSDLYNYRFTGEVTCNDGVGTDYATFFIKYGAYRSGASATEAMSNIIEQVVSTAGMAAYFDVSTTTVRLRIKGKAATSLYWAATIRYQAVKTNS